MKTIVSRENPHFKALKKLCGNSRERRRTNIIVLDGMHLIESHAQSGGQSTEIVVAESGRHKAEIAGYLETLPPGSAVTLLADCLFDELAPVQSPSGILALAPQPAVKALPDMDGDAVLLDGIQDPGNVGSILRSAAAAGFRQILLSNDCAQVWSPKVLRAAMGAHFQLALHEDADLPAFLDGYRGQAVSTMLDSATGTLYALDLSCATAWVFGSEGQGIRPAVAAHTPVRIRIPMPGTAESLNVAAAAAVCLFETVRQRV